MSVCTDDVERAVFNAFIRHYRCAGMAGPALTINHWLAVVAAGDDDGFNASQRLRDWSAILSAAASALDGTTPEDAARIHKIECEAYERAAKEVEAILREASQTVARDISTAIRQLGSKEGNKHE
jgi:hypothetical protein